MSGRLHPETSIRRMHMPSDLDPARMASGEDRYS